MKCPKCQKDMRKMDDLEIYICCNIYWLPNMLEQIEKIGYEKWCESKGLKNERIKRK